MTMVYKVREAETRYSVIDHQLAKAGRNLADRAQVRFEIPVTGFHGSPFRGVSVACTPPTAILTSEVSRATTGRNVTRYQDLTA